MLTVAGDGSKAVKPIVVVIPYPPIKTSSKMSKSLQLILKTRTYIELLTDGEGNDTNHFWKRLVSALSVDSKEKVQTD